MKVETAYAQSRTALRRAARTRGGDFARALEAARGTTAPHEARAPTEGTSLLAAQEVGADETERRRGHSILDRLEELRLGLLSGGLSRRSLEHLGALVAVERAQAVDPRLAQVLDEIDLRAKVELAKHTT